MPKVTGLSRSATPHLVANNVACSWLSAIGASPRQIDEKTFIVDDVTVHLYDSQNESPGQDGLHIDARELASTALTISLPAWHRITQAIGRGAPTPVNRPVAVGRQKDILMRALRLAEFSQAPLLTPASEALYRSVIRSTTGAFYSRNRQAMEAVGLERADLICAGLVWAANFHHRYRREASEQTTVKLLGRYVQQRCAQLARYGSFNRTSPIIYTDTLDVYDHAPPEGPSDDEVTTTLLERASYMPKEELESRLSGALQQNPNLSRFAKRLRKQIEGWRE